MAPPPNPSPPPLRLVFNRIGTIPRSALVALIALAVIIAVCLHAPLINGPWYWQWPWRTLSIGRTLLLAASLLPTLLAIAMDRSRPVLALALLTAGSFSSRFIFALVQDLHLHYDWLNAVVQSPSATSYFVDAAILSSASNWLSLYPAVLHQLHLHTQSKPPGPVAWYAIWISWLGMTRSSAIIGALVLGGLQAMVIPATAWMVRRITGQRDAALFAASFVALCPASSLVFPAIDPVYGLLTCAILLATDRALRRPGILNALLLGIILAAATFCSYTVLTLGTVVVAWTLLRRPCVRDVCKLIAGAAIGFLLFYGILWLPTGFDPWATFVAAWQNQHVLLAAHRAERPYPLSILFDLTDFSLGIGWIGWVAILGFSRDRYRWLCWLCVIQPVFIAATGLLQSETLRVWNFMLPLVAIAAGLAMARWSERERQIYMACAALVFIAIAGRLAFMVP